MKRRKRKKMKSMSRFCMNDEVSRVGGSCLSLCGMALRD